MAKLPLPKSWKASVRTSLQQVIGLAQYAFACSRSVAANSPIERMRLKAENQRLTQEVAWLTEELRIKDARMRSVVAVRRPYYSPQ